MNTRHCEADLLKKQKEFYTITELAEILCWSQQTVREMCADKEFPLLRYGKTHLIHWKAFENFCKTRRG